MATEKWKKENIDKVRAYRRKWYEKNKKHARAKVVERKKMLHKWFQEYRETLSCNSCPEPRWYVLDFHHKDPTTKEINLAHAITNGWSKKRILNEVAKCDVLCANCHRELHHLERV